MELFAKIVNGFGNHCAGVSSLIKLLAWLKKETPVQAFSCEFCEIFKSTSLRNTPVRLFWTEYKYNNTKMKRLNKKHNKMKRLNKKHNYILPHFIQFSKQILFFIAVKDDNQKQPFADVLQNSCQNFATFTGKHLYWNNFMKKRLQHRCFSLNIANFFGKAFLIKQLRWLLLDIYTIF